MDGGAGEAILQHRRHPDMIEAAAAVGGGPIARAIAPPGVKLLLWRDEMPDRVDEARRFLHAAEFLDLDRRVADDFQELFVRPDIGLKRRDVEIADEDHRLVGGALAFEPSRDLVDEA